MEKRNKVFIWDTETYKNLFCVTFLDIQKLQGYTFEISSRKNQLDLLLEFLKQLKDIGAILWGFNSLGFDYPILHFIQKTKKVTALKIHNEAQHIIESMKLNKFGKTIQERFHYLPQGDLYKMNHLDNPAKATSLKALAVFLMFGNVQEIPIDIFKELTDEEMDIIIRYNINDVLVTYKYFMECQEGIKLREELSLEYGKNFTNFSDSKIGSEIFIQEIEKVKPNSCFKYIGNKRTICQTKRHIIHLKDCILPYIKFNRPEFKALLEWFKKQAIKETKGVFSNLTEYNLGELAKYAVMVKKKSKKMESEPTEQELAYARRDNPFIEVEVNELKSGKKSYFFTWNEAEALNIKVNDHQFVFGVGGIHSSIESQVVKEDDDYIIIDEDVNSYYPNLSIVNNIFPNHLGVEFCHVYKDLYERRKTYPKGSVRNLSIKLALNSTYGNSNNQYSPFYDPKYTMTITVSGQLSLLMLIEMVLDKLENSSIIQSNTDGVTFKVMRKDSDKFNQIIKEWEKITGLEMERNDYKAMFVQNVNNYISVYTNDKVKLKGKFDYNLAHHQNPSSLVVKKAVEAFLTKDISLEEFITKHDNKYDFMLRTKIPKASKLVSVDSEGNEQKEQNVSRFYISKASDARTLIKVMPPIKGATEDRRMGICVGRTARICNNIDSFRWDIDYDYYIEEAKKLTDLSYNEEGEE
jgi:hypothetical protein